MALRDKLMASTAVRPDAFAYIRVSTTEQEKGNGPAEQLALAQKRAEEHGLNLHTHFQGQLFSDLGRSGFTGKHIQLGQFGRFIEAMRRNEIRPGTYLLIEALDRFSREERRKVRRLLDEMIYDYGIIVLLTRENKILDKDMDLGDDILVTVEGHQNHWQSKLKGQRVAAAKAKNAENVIAGIIKTDSPSGPSWLRAIHDANGKFERWEKVPAYCETIIKIFRLCAYSGYGSKRIANYLNEHGHETFEHQYRKKGQAPKWRGDAVNRILKNEAVLGTKEWADGAKNPNHYPPVIEDKRLWDDAQLVRNEQHKKYDPERKRKLNHGGRQSKDDHFIFSGMVFCGYCGSPLRHQASRPNNSYLYCDGPANECHRPPLEDRPDGRKRWPYQHFNECFFNSVLEFPWQSIMAGEKDKSELATLNQKREVAARKVNSATNTWRNYEEAIGEADTAEIRRRFVKLAGEAEIRLRDARVELDAVNAELAKLAQRGERQERGKQELQSTIDYQKLYAPGNTEQRGLVKGALSAFIERIRLYPAGLWYDDPELDNDPELRKEPCFKIDFHNGDYLRLWVDFKDPLRIVDEERAYVAEPLIASRYVPVKMPDEPEDVKYVREVVKAIRDGEGRTG
jgi:DNA invertase Pin-like site-specific DNA recombinase